MAYRRTLDAKNPQETDFKTTFKYPVEGGPLVNVTYVGIEVEQVIRSSYENYRIFYSQEFSWLILQTSDIGQATIVSGGIGKREISIFLEAKKTKVFKVIARIYGYWKIAVILFMCYIQFHRLDSNHF